MGGMIDISVLGDKALVKKLNKLPGRVQKRVVVQALRKGGKVILGAVKNNFAAIKVSGETTDDARKATKLRSIKRSRARVGVQVVTPATADESLGRAVAAMELGTSKTPAKSPIRDAVEANRSQVMSGFSRDIGAGITREAMKK